LHYKNIYQCDHDVENESFSLKFSSATTIINITFLREMAKMKNFQVGMPIDWKLSNELNEV